MAKPFTVLDCEQRSEAWYAARAGIFTASAAGEAFGKTVKGEWRADRKDLRTRLVLERITGKPQDDKFNDRKPRIVKDGEDREPQAIRLYENITGHVVKSCGFVLDNELPIGCSPDGVIGDFEGLIQAKCPKAATHLATIQNVRTLQESANAIPEKRPMGTHRIAFLCLPPEYLHQVCHELYVTGAQWCDYLSYHPDFPKTLQLITIRVLASDVDLARHAEEVRVFLSEVEAECDKIAGWAA